MDRHSRTGFAGRAVLGKDGLLAGFNLSICVPRGGAAAQLAMAAAFGVICLTPNSTESAVANGDTRTILLSSQHTHETGSFTFMVNGIYDQAALDKLNWFCRDWRLNEPTKMDPHLFDIIWEVYRELGSTQPIDVLSGYRSPQTNAMLRRRSRQVAQHSQHMQGKAIDAHFVDVSTARIRDIAMRMQAGGVGFYPTGMTPWVHIDSGDVRYWPRMSRDALTRLFPNGKTVFIPADGKPMPGFEQARAEIEARGGEVQTASGAGIGGLFSWLFGHAGGADDAEEFGRAGSDARHDGGDRQRAERPQRRLGAAGRGRRRRTGCGREGQARHTHRAGLRRTRGTGAGRRGGGVRFRARGGRKRQAQPANRPGLRQRGGASSDAPGQTPGRCGAAATRRGHGRFDGQRRTEVRRAPAAAQAG